MTEYMQISEEDLATDVQLNCRLGGLMSRSDTRAMGDAVAESSGFRQAAAALAARLDPGLPAK